MIQRQPQGIVPRQEPATAAQRRSTPPPPPTGPPVRGERPPGLRLLPTPAPLRRTSHTAEPPAAAPSIEASAWRRGGASGQAGGGDGVGPASQAVLRLVPPMVGPSSPQQPSSPPQPLAMAAPAAGTARRRDQRLWQLLWGSCAGVGVVRLAQLERSFATLEAAWSASPADLAARTGWPPALLAAVQAHQRRWGSNPLAELDRAWQGGRGLLLPGDGRWPAALDGLQRPPLRLHWRGRGSLWPVLARRQAIAVVGTRRPSPHGLQLARRIGAQLAAQGWPVVSGLAEGIDAAAHRGCLEACGAPVAVLGTPLQRVYPRHHEQLQQQVGRQGLLVSEWAADARVHPGHFASRNRLLVALATAVVVVECPSSSGALHSAELAWSQGLPLWAVPADTDRASAQGSNRLLARGATALLQPSDLTDQLGAGPLLGRSSGTRAPARGPGSIPGSGEARLLAALGQGAVSLEVLAERLAVPTPRLLSSLLELELAGLVQAEPGLSWRRR